MQDLIILDDSPKILGETLRFTGEDENEVLYHVEIDLEVFEYYLNIDGLKADNERVDWNHFAQELIIEAEYGKDEYYGNHVHIVEKKQRGWIFFPKKGNPQKICKTYVGCPYDFLEKNNKAAKKNEHKYTHFAPLF